MKTHGSIDVSYLFNEDEGVTMVQAELVTGGSVLSTKGIARCSGPDIFDPAVGFSIALGRAIEEMGRELKATGNREVKRQERARHKLKKEKTKAEADRKARGEAAKEAALAKLAAESKKPAKKATKRGKSTPKVAGRRRSDVAALDQMVQFVS